MSEKIRMLIVDDEESARTVLSFLIGELFPSAEVVGTANSVIEAIKLIHRSHPQIVFLDISMPHADGFDLLESLPDRKFEVVFTTSHQEHAIRAFREGAVDYLLKPIDEDELVAAVERIQKRLAASFPHRVSQYVWDQKLKVTSGRETTYLSIAEIVRIEAFGAYSKVIAQDNRVFTMSKNLRHFEQFFEPLPFFRIHNSHLINLRMVVGFLNENGGFVQMQDGSSVPAATRKVAGFHRAMQAFLR